MIGRLLANLSFTSISSTSVISATKVYFYEPKQRRFKYCLIKWKQRQVLHFRTKSWGKNIVKHFKCFSLLLRPHLLKSLQPEWQHWCSPIRLPFHSTQIKNDTLKDNLMIKLRLMLLCSHMPLHLHCLLHLVWPTLSHTAPYSVLLMLRDWWQKRFLKKSEMTV